VRVAWPTVRFAAAIHPHRPAAYAGRVADRHSPSARPRWRGVVAVGEIGLDYHYDFSPRDVQREVFAAQAQLALDAAAGHHPHTRGDRRHVAVLRGRSGRVRGVMHCFTGTVDEARLRLALGFYLSLAAS
jgi:TatD DNase family protein